MIDPRRLLILPLSLAACDREPEAVRDPVVAKADRVDCAIGGAALAGSCTVERRADRDGIVLTLRHGDGGFRRLRIARDGRGVIAADGAEAATVKIVVPNRIEVAIGDARYRLPATIGPVAR